MKRTIVCAILAAVLLIPSSAAAQGNPMMDAAKAQFGSVTGNLLKTAEKVPEALWSFKPTPEVRSFAQLIGHIADANMGICGAASSDKQPPMGAEKSMTTKAQLSKALADSIAYCDKMMAGMDDKKGMETAKFFIGGMTPRAMIFAFNTAHAYEHYGNLVTYMRINKIVPPSSEGQK